MKKLILVLFFWFYACEGYGQNIKSETGYVKFFSSALIEDITAENQQASAYFNLETGEAVFLIPIVGFMFEKSLMQEHFNENYMESDKYPEAYFKGKISGFSPTQAESPVIAEGEMTIHGITRKIRVPGKIFRSGNSLRMEAIFNVALEDYQVEIPKLMFQKIAEKVEVTTKFEFQYP
jgi:polyisoprenoid-binding protein YceI